ncbi:MAG: transcriptional regulator, ArsR family [uncultured Solirubrobacteraceae bacterium]|uniref:Transcriptional regulator, ArsR family n=1 Tax=uncultured Solirubrobacteraceae bacterium TaxID=1162706 RepID=A0A6J4S776_9ACTN|nr:MAG: transcriptional regulator, ArsR family [uncultured Solirubrobacteraceae bacterium]
MPPVRTIDDPRYVKALSHPLRVRILALLEEQEHSPVRLAERLHASLGTVSYHVRTLERLGLAELVRTTPRRGAIEHHYRARNRPTVSDVAWAAAPPAAKHALVGATLQQVHDYATIANAAGGFDRGDAHLSRTALQLDEEGWKEVAGLLERLLNEVDGVEARAADRLAEAGEDAAPVPAGLALMLFEATRFSDVASLPGPQVLAAAEEQEDAG